MDWVYLSPHLDDVALSCGGLVWEQANRGGMQAAVWTICAGDPPGEASTPLVESLHERWAKGPQAAAARREEDILSCQRIGATTRHLPIPDAIYRVSPATGDPLYASIEHIFGELSPEEEALVSDLQREFKDTVPETAELVCPMGLGGHVDHRLVRSAAEGLGRRMWYYADYPYVDWLGMDKSALKNFLLEGQESAGDAGEGDLESVLFPVSEAGMAAWVESVAAHASQISSFWPDLDTMQASLRKYCQDWGGVRLWRR